VRVTVAGMALVLAPAELLGPVERLALQGVRLLARVRPEGALAGAAE
jgi:hypothetical protein